MEINALPILSTGRLLSRREAAELLNVSPSTIWRLTRSGELRARRVGCQLRIAEADAEAYLRRDGASQRGA